MNILNQNKCAVVQDLLALYAEGEVSAATAGFVEEHLAACSECRRLLEDFQRPIFHAPERLTTMPGKPPEKTAVAFLKRLRRTMLIALVLLVLTATGLASATYYAGKNVAMRDPAYAKAEKMGLITPVRQSKKLGESQIIVDGVLFDTARTAVFYRMSPGPDRNREIDIEMKDDAGINYPYFAGQGIKGEHFIAELAPVDIQAQEVEVIFTDRASGEKAVFQVPVDTLKLAGATREINPGLEYEAGGLKVSVDRLILGVSQSVVEFTIAAQPESGVTGVGFGVNSPLSLGLGPDGRAHSAAAGFFGPPRPAPDAPPVGIPLLLDLTNGKSAPYEGAKFRTVTSTGAVEASFIFGSLDEDAGNLKLSFPPIYVYRQAGADAGVKLTLPEEGELLLGRTVFAGDKEIYLDRLTVKGSEVSLQYSLPGQHGYFPAYLPDFRLEDGAGRLTALGRTKWEGEIGKVDLHLFDPGVREVTLSLTAVGEKLPEITFDKVSAKN